jgi:GH18 family chitinase
MFFIHSKPTKNCTLLKKLFIAVLIFYSERLLMKMFKLFIATLVLAVVFYSCKKEVAPNTPPVTPPVIINITPPPPFGFYVVGYFPNYRTLADVPDVKFKMCNVINYAFFGVNSSGTLTVNNAALVPQVIAKAKAGGAKVMVSINDGSGDGKTNFKAMAATAAGRNTFVKDVMAKVKQYGFDGADIDWEYPSTTDGTDATFSALMKELSDSLHRDAKYYLTAALTPGKYAGSIRDGIRTEVFGYADFFNIMAYDDFSTTVPYKQHSDYNLAVTCLNYWLNTRAMPKEKCVLGLPAYGRPSGITQSGTIITYKEILNRGGSSQSDSAIVSVTNYPNYTIYYNGQPTTKLKALLAKDRANGVMLWELGQDAVDDNSLIKAACDAIGRTY